MKKMSYWKKAKIMADVQEKEAVKIHILYLHINPESVYYITIFMIKTKLYTFGSQYHFPQRFKRGA